MILKPLLSFFLIVISYAIIGQELTVEKIWKDYEFYGASVSGFRSMKDGEHFSKITTIDGNKSITKHAFSNYEGEGEPIVSHELLAYNGSPLVIDDYFFNENETKVLLTTETKSIYRRSFTAVYYLLDLNTKKIQTLDDVRSPQMLAEYSPDGKKVSYVFENNLYIKDLETNNVVQVTNDGKQNEILNGTSDWVYEEEFSITKAYGWSPDSKHVAFLKFNETDVKEFTMTYFNELYPDLYTFKYPKAGEDNSKVSAHLYSLKKGTISDPINLGEYEYIPRLKWSKSDNNLIIQTLNRHQNHLQYHLVSVDDKGMSATMFFEEKTDTYVEIDDNLLILNDGKTILRTSEASGYNHVYALCFDGTSSQITKGDWDVINFYGVDNNNTYIYYSSAENGPINKSIYKVDLKGKKKKLLSSSTGNNSAEFSNGMKYFIKTHSNANNPATYTLCNNSGKELAVLEDNSKLKSKLKSYSLSKKEFVKFKGENEELNGWMIKPPNFDPAKKYPVYVNIYGGPGANTVSDAWGGMNQMYHHLLAQKGYIIVSVDPRGTMYRGTKFKKSTYLQLGKLETEDFIAVGKELQSYSYVDGSRIGIMGWSYGGFMTSLAMTKGADIYKMGIAVAPVTNWRYYDNIYTERFMRTPEENADGYDTNSPINFVDKIEGKYLLIHGSGDDNVHYQNTMEMINAMVKADKQFDLFIYPNKNHGIYGGNTRNHLFNMMLQYTLENL